MRTPSTTKILYATAFLIVSFVTAGWSQHRIDVVITDLRDTTGQVMIGVFMDSKTFLKKPDYGAKVKTKQGEVRASFDNLPPGDYAISIIHDANRNGKLDSNFMGIPKEGFGFSNNVMGMFGPPSFDKAKINVNSSTQVRIRARYL